MAQKQWTITSDKFLSKDQVERLIHHFEERRDLAIARGLKPLQSIKVYYILRSLLETGLRVQEFCDLINSDFLGQKLIVRRGKGGRPRTVLLTRSTANLIKEWGSVKCKIGISNSPDEPMFPSKLGTSYTTRGVQKLVKVAFAELGLPSHLSCHSLRHTNCAFLLESKKVSLATIRDNLGHHSISVTNLYAHAVGNIDDVDVFDRASSENTEKSELKSSLDRLSGRNPVQEFLRKANLK